MDPNYDPASKTSSVSSTSSSDTIPSLAATSIYSDMESPALHDHATFDDSSATFTKMAAPTSALYDDYSFSTLSSPLASLSHHPSTNVYHALRHDTDDASDMKLETFDFNKTTQSTMHVSTMHQESSPVFLQQSQDINVPQPSPSMDVASVSLHAPPKRELVAIRAKPAASMLRENEAMDAPGHVNGNDATFSGDDNQLAGSVSRELLTEDEKRANHIASEQKRRNTIRNGFKEMTDIIPTLKNINNSKSTILFKAADYIRHLEKRNRHLREKLQSLQLRLQVHGHMGGFGRSSSSSSSSPMNAAASMRRHSHYLNDHQQKRSRASSMSFGTAAGMMASASSSSSSSSSNANASPMPDALAALAAHNSQQRQLELLQQQLRYQHALLTKHNIPTSGLSSAMFDTPSNHATSNATSNAYHASISIPSDQHTTYAPLSQNMSQNHPPHHHHHHQHQHRASAPALVIPTSQWHQGSSNAASFAIPADDDVHHM